MASQFMKELHEVLNKGIEELRIGKQEEAHRGLLQEQKPYGFACLFHRVYELELPVLKNIKAPDNNKTRGNIHIG